VQEVRGARTIAERGVVLVGTAHGNTLPNLMSNPVLRPLVGDISGVTLGDEMARKTNRNIKVCLRAPQDGWHVDCCPAKLRQDCLWGPGVR
jgi:stage III sporulation protein SpoIIIAA